MAVLVIVVTAAALYAPNVHDYFTQDDFGVVGLFSQRSLALFPRWFTAPWTENIWGYVPDEIRPFPAASYVVMAWFGAAAPEPNHILNIALHAVNAVLVFLIAEEAAGLSLVPAAFAGVIFAVLPIQAESVSWVTGRVDSLPAFFYFGSFLLYVRNRYWWSVALFFCALFSKQNTITMFPALIAFDGVVRAGKVGRAGGGWRYVPYIVLTIAFLALRYAIFHEVARESILSMERVREFLSDCSRHLARLVFGGPGIRHWMWRDTLVVAVVAAIAARRWRATLYFGGMWMVLGMAPILMAGYYSPRHMYLAALGWAVLLGIALQVVIESRVRSLQAAAVAAAVVVAAAYGVQLHGVVRDWSHVAAISGAAVRQIEREAATQPEGTLILAGVPRGSWAFAVPYSVRPPFTATDLTRRVSVISDSDDHCCNAMLWTDYTRKALRAWHDRAERPPVVALYWNPKTGRMSRVSDRDDPQLRTLVALLLETKDRASLDSVIRGLLNDYAALR